MDEKQRIQPDFSSLPQFALRYQLGEFLVFHENSSYVTRKQQAQINTKLHITIFEFMIYL